MTIGKKIGGGFCAIIFLTVFLGLWAINSMNHGSETALILSEDRLPRLINWSQMQTNLLRATYFMQEYISSGKEEEVATVFKLLKEFQEKLSMLRQINSKNYYENTAQALAKGEKDISNYMKLLNKERDLYQVSENQVGEMIESAGQSLAEFENLIAAMSGTLSKYADAGEGAYAKIYARNIAATNKIYANIANTYQNLLIAERNNDIPGIAKIRELLPALKKQALEVEKNIKDEECQKIFTEAMRKFDIFSTKAMQVATSLSDFIQSGNESFEFFEIISNDITKLVDLTIDNARQYTQNAVKDLSNSTFIITIILVIAGILGIIIALAITRMIVRPLSTTQKFAEEVAEGKLDRELGVHSTDETGLLANSLRKMVGALKHNINEAREKSTQAEKATEQANIAMAKAEEAARQAESAKREGMLTAASQLEKMVEIISSASTELSAQIEQSDRGTSESAQRLQEAATAMNEMNATVQEVARNAGSASQASDETRSKALAGQKIVHEVVDGIADVQKTSLVLKDDMAQLNERAQDINRIMGVISDIADQTNLLALNAAIEAARAGEAGRGFAVVADEVRKLAEKTMTSTQDVSSAIHAIQESTTKSMMAVDNAVASIGKATDLANQSGGALEEIVSTVEATSDQVRAIAAASEEQSAASEEINRSITEVNDMSRLTADAMREASVAVSDLANQAQRLNELILDMKKA